ncbi:MAG TPA: tetratricopeptide repeat protein [Vicinamibacteria bacterium]|nr:tetratricopeptide repeat protein [Vicinamibacteria bacterium]
MTTLRPGTTFSHYQIVDTLGHGGQATAFKAEDLRLSRPVVIKALRPDLASSDTARRRFEREAILCSALDNPHIQSVYDFGETEGLYYIVLQYVDGPTLKQFMGGRPLDTLSALSIAIQLADALAVAHASGIVHRDLKPANIIVGPGGQAKILDFGLAKMLVPDAAETAGTPPARADDPLTDIGVPYGSMGYGSPEQAAGQSADHRTDVFSLGVILYEMVTGVPPFRGRHAVEVLNAVINSVPRPITDTNPRALPALQPILDRAMAKAPRDRYQTMAAFRDELKALMRRLTRETGVVPTETTATLLAPQRARAAWSISGTLSRVLSRLRPGLPGREPRSGPTPPGAPSRPPTWGTEKRPTLAVLPFRNLAGNPDAAFYEFSLADGVITELANVKSIVVRPSAYIAPYVGQTVDPRQAGEELAASLVLTGGFIRTPERMRVTAQLLEVATGHILWSDRIDLLSRDLLDVQDEIAERMLAGLKLRLTAEEQEQIERPLTRSPEAYEFYMRGRDALFRYVLRTHDEADLDEAVKMMHEAIGLDPDFAGAHATLGRCYVLYAQGWGGAENFVLAERSLKHALAADPALVDARLQMVYVDMHHGDKEKARSRAAELLQEQPDDPSVLFVAGMLHRLDGLYDRALATFDRLLGVNPTDVVIVAFNKARVFTHQGRFEEAVAEIDRGRAAEPEHPLLKTFLAVALFNQGMVDDAQALLEDVLRQNPHFDGVLPLLGWCLSSRGQHEQARALVTDRVREIATADHDIALWLAEFYALEGMVEEGLEWLRLAVRIGNENYPLLARSPKLDALRSDARFAELLEELRQRWEERRRAEEGA